jgi:general secretion pathway protein B
MSILLDALRKSEEQRQIGSTPTLSSGLDSRAAGDGAEHQWLPLSMMALSAILMAWIGWNQFSEPLTVSGTVVPGPAVATIDRESADNDAPAETAVDATGAKGDADLPRSDAIPDGQAVARPAPTVADLQPSGPEAEADRQQRLSQAVTDFEAEVPPEPNDSSPPGAAAATEADSEVLLADDAASDLGEEAAAQAFEPAVPEPISYWEVPQSVRESMPELRITVLVYAPEPEDRFLLINGERLGEQDTLGGGVMLEEIRRDGAVFVYRKYRFLIKG